MLSGLQCSKVSAHIVIIYAVTFYSHSLLNIDFPLYLQYLAKMPRESGEHVVVVSCEEDKGVCQPALEAGITVVSSEFLFTGILRQEILMDKYPFCDAVTMVERNAVLICLLMVQCGWLPFSY